VLLIVPGDGLRKLYVEPPARCNLSCRTCMRNTWEEPLGTMSLAVFDSLLRQIADLPGLQTAQLSGIGEPLLHPQIVEMVGALKARGLAVEIVTNATLLNAERSEALIRAGLDRLVVSLDGARAAGYEDVREGAQFKAVVENMRTLRTLRSRLGRDRPEIGVAFVAMRRNVADLGKLPALMQHIGATHLVVSNLLPHSEAMRDEVLYDRWAARSPQSRPSPLNPEVRLPKMDLRPETVGPLVDLLRTRVNEGPLFGNTVAREPRCQFVTEGCAAVAWDGGISPCLPLLHSYPCYILGRPKYIRRFVLGNVLEDDLAAVWDGETWRRFRDRVRRFDFPPCTDCGGCDVAATNETDCFGNPFPTCGDCLWARGLIQCP